MAYLTRRRLVKPESRTRRGTSRGLPTRLRKQAREPARPGREKPVSKRHVLELSISKFEITFLPSSLYNTFSRSLHF